MILRRSPIRRSSRKGTKTSKRRREQMSLKKQCAALWSLWVKREGRCEFIGMQLGNAIHTRCGGALQAMHGFGKKAYPGVRYAVWNGFCGCAAVHSYFTWRPPEWENYLRTRWGEEMYQHRLSEAMLVRKYELGKVAQTFRVALSALEVGADR